MKIEYINICVLIFEVYRILKLLNIMIKIIQGERKYIFFNNLRVFIIISDYAIIIIRI